MKCLQVHQIRQAIHRRHRGAAPPSSQKSPKSRRCRMCQQLHRRTQSQASCPPSNYAGAQRSWRWTWKKVPLSTHRSATSSGMVSGSIPRHGWLLLRSCSILGNLSRWLAIWMQRTMKERRRRRLRTTSTSTFSVTREFSRYFVTNRPHPLQRGSEMQGGQRSAERCQPLSPIVASVCGKAKPPKRSLTTRVAATRTGGACQPTSLWSSIQQVSRRTPALTTSWRTPSLLVIIATGRRIALVSERHLSMLKAALMITSYSSSRV
mmetsp:Transcript_27160/g.63728  ORF Transcript_27160/g.63728 Transcript_27160/m.63728 type:complete len:264 (+) Transcript_27160:573-1364(+)